MHNKKIINVIKNRLIKTYNPHAIYIFGSYAWGNPDHQSDLDILIIVGDSDQKICKRPIPAYEALRGIKISTDILVYTLDEFNKMAQEKSSLCNLVKTKGKILYEAA